MKLLVLKPIRLKKGNTLTEVGSGQVIEIRDPQKARDLIRQGYLVPLPSLDQAEGSRAGTAAAYFREKYLELIDHLDQAWPTLPGEKKERIFSLVEDLDRSWLSEDREGFDRTILEIREAAALKREPEQAALFGGGDQR